MINALGYFSTIRTHPFSVIKFFCMVKIERQGTSPNLVYRMMKEGGQFNPPQGDFINCVQNGIVYCGNETRICSCGALDLYKVSTPSS
jgi:hypothetical protein